MENNHKIIISKYSYQDTKDYYVENHGDNISNIFDKLIELAARKCDHYASDIFWDMKTFADIVSEGKKFDRILVFRETGVHSIDVDNLNNLWLSDVRALAAERCIWRIEYKLDLDDMGKPEWKSTLTRVYIKVETQNN